MWGTSMGSVEVKINSAEAARILKSKEVADRIGAMGEAITAAANAQAPEHGYTAQEPFALWTGVTDRAVASAFAAAQEPSSVALKPGQSMTIDDLLKSLMVKSANDAAVVLAERSGLAHGAPVDVPGAALKMFFLSVWMVFPDLKRAQNPFSRT